MSRNVSLLLCAPTESEKCYKIESYVDIIQPSERERERLYTIMIISRNSSRISKRKAAEEKEKKWRRGKKVGPKKRRVSKRNYASNFHMLHLTHFTTFSSFRSCSKEMARLSKKMTEEISPSLLFSYFHSLDDDDDSTDTLRISTKQIKKQRSAQHE